MINNGASFGIQIPGMIWWQVMIILLVIYLWSRDKKAWGWGLIALGGGLNLMERLIWGGVRDYWQIPATSIYNNVNDYIIGVGVIQLLWYLLWKKRQK